jgi:hypothetical protein
MEAVRSTNLPLLGMSIIPLALLILHSESVAKGAAEISEIGIERTNCFGSCPSYYVEVRSDGRVSYDGKDYVKEKGAKDSKISREKFLQLAKKVRAIDFFNLESEYVTQEVGNSSVAISDLPTTIVTVKAGRNNKRVADYLGAPNGLRELEELIDDTTNVVVWTGRRTDPELSDIPYYDSFPANQKLTYRGLIREMGKLDGKPRYMLCLVKNTLNFDLHTPPGLDPSQFANYLVEVAGTIGENGDLEVSEMHRIRRYDNAEKKSEPDAQSKSERR